MKRNMKKLIGLFVLLLCVMSLAGCATRETLPKEEMYKTKSDQYVKMLTVDCDKDTLLAKVEQIGAACHTGNRTCFYQPIAGNDFDAKNPLQVFESVYKTIVDRKQNPKEGSYTNYLFEKGLDKILKKVGEETAETIIAAKNNDKNEVIYELSDLLYHISVLLSEKQITWDDVFEELKKRELKESNLKQFHERTEI